MSILKNKLFDDIELPLSRYHLYSKLPEIQESSQKTDTVRLTNKADSSNELIYFDLIRSLQLRKSAKLTLRGIKSTKKPENYQQLERQAMEQRKSTQSYLRAKKEDELQLKLKGSVSRIQKLQNSTGNKIGLQSLKVLEELQRSRGKSIHTQNDQIKNLTSSTFRRSQVDDQGKLKFVLCGYINQNKKFFNKEVIKVENYERTAPFKVEQLNFVEKLLPNCQIVNKVLGFDEENLKRNNLTLEKILLERMLLNERNDYIEQQS